jgi:nucleoside-diphosphate-sugar epimerase
LASRSERVLVTGGTGFTGRALVTRLRSEDYEVISLSHDAAGPDSLKADLRNFDGLEKLLSYISPDVVVHLAGIAAPSHQNVQEIYAANVVGTANLLAALVGKKLRPRLVVVASSAQVYDVANAVMPLNENASLAPKNHYAVSKRTVEEIAGLYSSHYPIVVTRPFNYTGPGQPKNFIVPKIVQHYAERRSEINVGNLDLFRDISDIRRVVEAYVRLISSAIEPTTVNICSGRAVYLGDILKTMENISGHVIKIITDSSLIRSNDPHTFIGSPSRLLALVGDLPNPEFRETLLSMYATLKRNTELGH